MRKIISVLSVAALCSSLVACGDAVQGVRVGNLEPAGTTQPLAKLSTEDRAVEMLMAQGSVENSAILKASLQPRIVGATMTYRARTQGRNLKVDLTIDKNGDGNACTSRVLETTVTKNLYKNAVKLESQEEMMFDGSTLQCIDKKCAALLLTLIQKNDDGQDVVGMILTDEDKDRSYEAAATENTDYFMTVHGAEKAFDACNMNADSTEIESDVTEMTPDSLLSRPGVNDSQGEAVIHTDELVSPTTTGAPSVVQPVTVESVEEVNVPAAPLESQEPTGEAPVLHTDELLAPSQEEAPADSFNDEGAADETPVIQTDELQAPAPLESQEPTGEAPVLNTDELLAPSQETAPADSFNDEGSTDVPVGGQNGVTGMTPDSLLSRPGANGSQSVPLESQEPTGEAPVLNTDELLAPSQEAALEDTFNE